MEKKRSKARGQMVIDVRRGCFRRHTHTHKKKHPRVLALYSHPHPVCGPNLGTQSLQLVSFAHWLQAALAPPVQICLLGPMVAGT